MSYFWSRKEKTKTQQAAVSGSASSEETACLLYGETPSDCASWQRLSVVISHSSAITDDDGDEEDVVLPHGCVLMVRHKLLTWVCHYIAVQHARRNQQHLSLVVFLRLVSGPLQFILFGFPITLHLVVAIAG